MAPMPTPTNTPMPMPSGGGLTLPIPDPSYDNNYTEGVHGGYDITSVSGNRTVYSMGPGVVKEMEFSKWFYVRVEMDAGYYINYVHIETTSLEVGDRVEGNYSTIIGMYGEVGELTAGYPHVHVQFESPIYHAIDPAPYWPGGAPTQWRW